MVVNEETMEQFSDSMRTLKKHCAENGINDEKFCDLYLKSLDSLDKNNQQAVYSQRRFISYKNLVALLVAVYIAFNFNWIYSWLACNLHDLIYPGLRLLRRISIPVISLFPALTEYYQETCLIHNPFFTVVDMDCWPCSTVTNVGEVHDFPATKHQNVAPFIYETDQKAINFDMLRDFYHKNREIFDKESHKIVINNKQQLHPNEVFQDIMTINEERNFYLWKFNTMNAARLLRQIIPRPKVVPKFGQSTERYIIMDSSRHLFHVPDTECSFSFILTLSGTRMMELVPAEECKHQCKALKIELKESYLLWYNWWYWKPVMLPTTGNTTFIAHVGSYC